MNYEIDSTLKEYATRLGESGIKALRHTLQNREEVLRAFIAKYGFEPDRYICVQQQGPVFELPEPRFMEAWYVRRMTDEEYELFQKWGFKSSYEMEKAYKELDVEVEELRGFRDTVLKSKTNEQS